MLSICLVSPSLPSVTLSALIPEGAPEVARRLASVVQAETVAQAANPPEKPEDIAITDCYDDANANGNQCGEAHSKTCTDSDGRGECCSAGGNCGSDWNFCGPTMQAEFSHGKNLCEDGMASDGFVLPEDERVEQQQMEEEEEEEALGCFTDANVGSLQCGPVSHATCTGGDTGKGGECCSSAGYCGSGDTFCGDSMQVEYSHGKNLCEEAVADTEVGSGGSLGASTPACVGFACPGAETPKCLSVEHVARAWVHGVSPLSKVNAEALCIPAVTIAAGSAYHTIQDGWTSPCMNKFDPLVEAEGFDGTRKGLWQISVQFFEADPEKQAATAYDVYMGGNSTYGCLAEWCITSTPGCSAVIPGIGQDDPSVTDVARFCHGVWSGASAAVDNKLQAIAVAAGTDAGKELVKAACAKAVKTSRAPGF